MSYLIFNTCSVFVCFLSDIPEDADIAQCLLVPHFCSSRWREKEEIAKSPLFFFALQLTALIARLFLDLDSSPQQVTQHPAPTSPSILARPTQPLHPIIPLSAGCISDRWRDELPCLHPFHILSNARRKTFHGAFPLP